MSDPHLTRLRRSFAVVVATAAALTFATMTTSASAAPSKPSAVTLDVQTYNLDLGADLTPLFLATGIPSLKQAAAQVYADVEASRPAERMQAVARIIAKQRPDVVGLQEVATWQVAPYVTLPNGLPVVVVPYQTTYDFLHLLLNDLAALGVGYQAVSSDVTFDSAAAVPIAIPISGTVAARYVDQNVVLVSDALTRHAAVSNPQDANYQAKFTVTLLGIVPVSVGRGWASIDITQRGRTFRFFDTHLEAYGTTPLKDNIRNPQAVELAATVTSSPYPTITVGDFNARPTMCATWRQPPQAEDANTVAYGTMQSAWMEPVMAASAPEGPLRPGQLDQRTRQPHRCHQHTHPPHRRRLPQRRVQRPAELRRRNTTAERTQPNGLWPSDHASTVAKVRLDAAP